MLWAQATSCYTRPGGTALCRSTRQAALHRRADPQSRPSHHFCSQQTAACNRNCSTEARCQLRMHAKPVHAARNEVKCTHFSCMITQSQIFTMVGEIESSGPSQKLNAPPHTNYLRCPALMAPRWMSLCIVSCKSTHCPSLLRSSISTVRTPTNRHMLAHTNCMKSINASSSSTTSMHAMAHTVQPEVCAVHVRTGIN